MNVVVYGGVHFNNVQQVYEVFHSLVGEQEMGRMWTTPDEGAPELLARLCASKGVPCTVVPAAWLVDGSFARRNQRIVLVERACPEMVVLFPGGELEEMRALCAARDIPVWDLSELPFADLGSGLQLGDEEMSADYPF